MSKKNKHSISEQVGNRLREARILSGYKTIAEFSASHNIPRSTYNQYEIGDRMLGVDLAIKFSDIFKTNLVWLLTGKGCQNITNKEIVYLPKQTENKLSIRDLSEKQFLSMIKKDKNTIVSKNMKKFQATETVDSNFLKEVIKKSFDILKNVNTNVDSEELAELSVTLYLNIISGIKNSDNLFNILNATISKFEGKIRKGKKAINF